MKVTRAVDIKCGHCRRVFGSIRIWEGTDIGEEGALDWYSASYPGGDIPALLTCKCKKPRAPYARRVHERFDINAIYAALRKNGWSKDVLITGSSFRLEDRPIPLEPLRPS
jgi:hypothetical protein